MNLFNSGQRISCSYATYDQDATLDVRFSIYDISSGTGVLLETVVASHLNYGVYEAGFIPISGKIYLAIGLVYVNDAPTEMRSPVSYTFREVGSIMLAASYATYDQNDGLFIRSAIYDTSGVSPVFIQNSPMTLIEHGVYVVMYVGTAGKAYDIVSVVFTDNTYSTVDTGRSPASEDMDVVGQTTIVIELQDAVLEGQTVNAVLEGYCA